MAERRRARVPAEPAGRVWTREGLTPEQLAGGQWRVRWTDTYGVEHDCLAIPIQPWGEAFPARGPGPYQISGR